MIFLIAIILASIGSLLIVFWAVRGNIQPVQDVEDVRKLLQPIDLQSFQNLIDPAQDMFLRRRLTGRAFRTGAACPASRGGRIPLAARAKRRNPV